MHQCQESVLELALAGHKVICICGTLTWSRCPKVYPARWSDSRPRWAPRCQGAPNGSVERHQMQRVRHKEKRIFKLSILAYMLFACQLPITTAEIRASRLFLPLVKESVSFVPENSKQKHSLAPVSALDHLLNLLQWKGFRHVPTASSTSSEAPTLRPLFSWITKKNHFIPESQTLSLQLLNPGC